MHVELRETTDEDLPILFAHQADPLSSELATFPSRDWDAFVAHQTKVQADPQVVTRTIIADGEVVGGIASFPFEDVREVGYWIDRAHWGKGIATAALRAMLALDRTRPLSAWVAAHNSGSRRVLEKCGFALVKNLQVDGVDGFILRLDASS